MSKPLHKDYEFRQQLSYCCVPAVLQMIFNRRGYIEQPQPFIGKRLGQIVPPDVVHQFNFVQTRHSAKGYGTRVDIKKYSLPRLFKELELPLAVTFELKNKIPNVYALAERLAESLANKKRDTILSVCTGALEGAPQKGAGHVLVLTGLEGSTVHYLDPETGPEKTSVFKLYRAMQSTRNYDGLWHIDTVKPVRSRSKSPVIA